MKPEPPMDRDGENTRLLENVVTELQHIKEKLNNTNIKLDTEITNQGTIISNQTATNELLTTVTEQNVQIIELLTPKPSDDISSLGGSISTPVNK